MAKNTSEIVQTKNLFYFKSYLTNRLYQNVLNQTTHQITVVLKITLKRI